MRMKHKNKNALHKYNVIGFIFFLVFIWLGAITRPGDAIAAVATSVSTAVSATSASTSTSTSSATPIALSSVPLAVSAIAKPNIMFLVDNSGSMSNIVPETPYVAGTSGMTCASANLLPPPGSSYIDIRVLSTGNAYFNYNGTDYDWGSTGNSNSLGITGRKARCFNPAQNYNARLYGDSVSATYVPTTYLPAIYPGSYLNWYFGSTPTNWGSGARNKPGTARRMDIAKASVNGLVTSLSNVRIGLSTYSAAGNGGNVLVGVNDISTNLSTFQSQVATLTPTGATPLAASLRDIGRYFVQGYNNNLTLHPGKTNQSTASAYNVFDKVPVYASGVVQTSPIQYFCQKNFVIIVTDGLPQGDRVMNSYLSDYDGDCVNRNPACLAYDEKPGQYYESLGSDYLDDVAAALYDINLRPDLRDFNGNAIKNNAITYTIGFADPQIALYPDLLQHTADNGGGVFVLAGNTVGLQSALSQALTSITGQVGSATSASFSTSSLQASTALFTATFNTTRWSGELSRYALTNNGGQVGSVQWQASTLLDNLSPNSRVIFTYNKDSKTAVPFRTYSQLAAAQQADLAYGGDSTRAQAVIDYLRGDRSQEGVGTTYQFRTRARVLGDIVDSTPVYVGAPAAGWLDVAPFPSSVGSRYSDFKTAQQNRIPMVYAGSNDGMLHGFRGDNSATGGKELLAYVPYRVSSSVASAGLHYLTNPSYSHTFYVDETPAINDAYIKVTPSGSAAWRTILVNSLGRGGPGLFALDITVPSQFSETNADALLLWEFTDADNADLGYSIGSPAIALMNNGRWAAIFGNGYNSAAGVAKLFILYLDGGLSGTWTSGVDYQVISTNVGSAGQPNGLSAPVAVDLDGNGTADRIYAGDLYGNMWAFDVSASSASSWGNAYGTQALFQAKDSSGTLQPVTVKPIVTRHPTIGSTSSNAPDVLVVFGTGQYLTYNDVSNTNTQTMYAVWDSGQAGLTRSQLVAQTVSTNGNTRTVSSNTVPYAGNGSARGYGWFIDFTGGERMNAPAKIRNNNVFFNTIIPNNTACSYGGTGWLMSVTLNDGANPTSALFDTNNDGAVNDSDKVNNTYVAGQKVTTGLPAAPAFRGNWQYTTTSAGNIQTRQLASSLAPKLGRSGWHELRRNPA